MASVFIIHGHDIEARTELVKFIKSLGLEVILFEDVADQLDPSPFIADVVMEGIKRADAVIALFTPDEQAILYEPQTGEYKDERWQARPNVLFEAGVAFGIAAITDKKKTILVTLGADIQLFSDVSGMHFIDLSADGAKVRLRERLRRIVSNLTPKKNWLNPRVSGDFETCTRYCWPFYDELTELESQLKQQIDEVSVTPLRVLREVAKKNMKADWEEWTSKAFMNKIDQYYGDEVADITYWSLIVYGFLSFNEIEPPWWDDEDHWANSVDYSYITARGVNFLYKLQQR